MKKIFLIRHGETYYNQEGRYQGQLDIELNETGIDQAKKLSTKIDFNDIDVIHCSDLVRAKKTLELLLKDQDYKCKVEYTEELREKQLGELEGKLITGKEKIYKFGETREESYQRCTDFFDSLISDDMSRVLLITHGGVIHIFLDWLQNRYNYYTNIKIPNCCFICTRIEGNKVEFNKLY